MPQYSDYILVSGTTETIKKNTKGSRYVVTNDGFLVISSGGTLSWSDSTDHYITYGGAVIVYSGGTAYGGTYLETGCGYVYAGGIASSPDIRDSSWFVVSSGGKVYNADIFSRGVMDVRSSGFAYRTTVSGGEMRVEHYASTTFVYSGGLVRVGSGATLLDTYVNRAGAVIVSSGGTAQTTDIFTASATIYGKAYYNHISGGGMSIMSGGYANTNEVINGDLYVSNGGTVTSSLISSGGSMNVSKGGFASKTTIFKYGTAYIGGTASGTVLSGGSMDLFGSSYNGVYSAGIVSIGYGGYSYNEVFSNTRTYVLGSGSASGVVYGGTLGSGCSVIIDGGRFGGKTISNAFINVTTGYADVSALNGAVATIKGGVFNAYAGGVMTSAVISGYGSSKGKMYVMSGAIVKDVNVSANAHLGIMIGGSVTYASAGPSSGSNSASIGVSSGGRLGSVLVYGGMLDIGSGGSVTSAIFSSGGKAHVSGTIGTALVGSGCPVQVSSGGAINSALINEGGRINVNGGKLYDATVAYKGILSIASGGTASGGTIRGSALVNATGFMSGGTVSSGGQLYISGSGSAMGTLIASSGYAVIHNSGVLFGGSASSGGLISVLSGGNAGLCIISSGGTIKCSAGANVTFSLIEKGGKITGAYNCSSLVFSSGGIADFDISGRAAGNASAFVSELGEAMSQSAVFTLSIFGGQPNGKYKLASGAAGFDKTITVKNWDTGATLGTLKVGQTTKIGGVNYKLELDSDSVLSVTVGAAAPASSAKGDVDGNGVSDVLFQYSGGDYQLGYWMNGTNEWRGQGLAKPAEWEVLGSYDMNNNGKADSVLVGNVEVGGVKGAYIGYYLDSVDADANWQNIGYLTNAEDIVWKNKVGNLTGNAGMNSIVWYAPEAYSLGAWTDGTTHWVSLSESFGGGAWKLVGCGDFNGDGKDSVVMSYSNGQMFYAVGIDGVPASLGSANWSGWEIRAIGDFAGDGKDDLVLFHNDTGAMVMCANGYVDSYVSIGQLDKKDWFVVGAGDYNGDAKDDMLVRQYSTGMLGYYVSGDTSKWVELGRGVDMNWTVIA